MYISFHFIFYWEREFVYRWEGHLPRRSLQSLEEKHQLPKTSAITMMEYEEYFRPQVEQGYDVIHVNLGSAYPAPTKLRGRSN